MIKYFANLNNKNFEDKYLFIFFSIFPITFLLGNLLINLFLILINLIFLIKIFKKNYNFDLENKILFYLFVFLFLSFLINLLFSDSFRLTYLRVLKFILIFGFVLSFHQLILIYKQKELKNLYYLWSLTFLIVFFDIIFELIFKQNTIGMSSIIPGRIVSFSGNEMTIGHYFSAFSLFVLSYFHLNFKKKNFGILIAIIFIIISFLIGERSNFVKSTISISLFILIVYEINLKYKLLSLSSIIIIFVLILNLNENYKIRYFNQVAKILTKDGIKYYLDNSIYGAHYNVAKEIFKDNPIFGVGIKNYRIESFSKKYDDLDHKENNKRGNTHPHQTHYEFLSETGLFGYSAFLIFIIVSFVLFLKNYKQDKNLYQLSGMIYVLVSLIPLLPSGSFFSTYTSGLFWINYAVMAGYIKK